MHGIAIDPLAQWQTLAEEHFLKSSVRSVLLVFTPLAVQLHFIQCPFPNQIQFGLGNYPRKIDKYFQTKSSLVWKIIVSNFEGNKFQTKSSLVWEKNADKCRRQKSQTNSSLVWKYLFNNFLDILDNLDQLLLQNVRERAKRGENV